VRPLYGRKDKAYIWKRIETNLRNYLFTQKGVKGVGGLAKGRIAPLYLNTPFS